jgi:hypothetical protein
MMHIKVTDAGTFVTGKCKLRKTVRKTDEFWTEVGALTEYNGKEAGN